MLCFYPFGKNAYILVAVRQADKLTFLPAFCVKTKSRSGFKGQKPFDKKEIIKMLLLHL